MARFRQKLSADLQKRIRSAYKDWPLDEEQFELRTGWAESYEGMFARNFSSILGEDELLDMVLTRGRAILTGRAGDGKTWLLRRLHMRMLDRGGFPLFLDLKTWSADDYSKWSEWTSDSVGDAADFLLRSFSAVGIGVIDFDRVAPSLQKLLLVDGLNEVNSSIGVQIIAILDELVRSQINLSVLVSDRLTRRELPPTTSRWSIGMVLPLSTEQIKAFAGRQAELNNATLLDSPFFLNALRKGNVKAVRRSEASEQFLLKHGRLSASDLDRVAHAAYQAYSALKSRVIQRGEIERVAGTETLIALEKAGILIPLDDDGAYFAHHLIHDYLAARHFAKLPCEGWTPKSFAALSFDASSFDAIGLVFEQVESDRADRFLRQLYDWNLYAAGYALAQATDADVRVGAEMRTVMYAMLAEKRFDSILATRERATDSLAVIQLSDVKPYLSAKSREQIICAVERFITAKEWFLKWKAIFITRQAIELQSDDLTLLKSPDSIIGWTVSNVAKRPKVDSELPQLLSHWLREELGETPRWRIAHVLGAYPTSTSLVMLRELLDADPDASVRYGTIRSIVELASRASQTLRSEVSDTIRSRVASIREQPKIYEELRSSLLLELAPPNREWFNFVAEVVRAFFIETDDTSERDLWRRCLSEAEHLYLDQTTPSDEARGARRRLS